MKLEKGVNSKLSVRWKWTFIISASIFFAYLIFAVLVYYSTQQALLDKEQSEIEMAMEETNKSLELNISDLNEENIQDQINRSQLMTDYFTSYDEKDAVDTRAHLSQLSLRVFNAEGEEVYAIGNNDYAFNPTQPFIIRPISSPGNDFSLSGSMPVYARFNDQHIGYIQIINSLDGFHLVVGRIFQAIFFIGFLILFFSFILALFVTDNLLKPIRRLKNAMAGIIEEPESETRLVVNGTDELAEMAMIYNKMIDRIQVNIESQKQFVEDVSHELRTPVAIVEGHLKLLDRWGKDDPEILEESIHASLQEITRMKSLVQEMLDLSRAAQVDIQYRHERTNVSELMRLVHNNMQLVHSSFVVTYDEDVEGVPIVNMYRNHLEQVLIILLDNAVKYSKDRKEVHISLATTGNHVQIAIQDFGEGISDEEVDKIFDRFYRIDKARSREKGGNGLGLSIAKQLIEGYGGTISVESVKNYGSVFRIELELMDTEEAEENNQIDQN